jgi:hypothetical protein
MTYISSFSNSSSLNSIGSCAEQINFLCIGGKISFLRNTRILLLPLLVFLFTNGNVCGQNALNSGDFYASTWGSSQSMSASAGSSLIITKAVSTTGDKYFRFYGDGSPCGEYQPTNNGDFFSHNTVVTSPNADCGSARAWRINVPTTSSNVVFKTDGGNDGVDRSIAFVIQGAVRSILSTSRDITTPTKEQSPVITATLGVGTLNTGQGLYLRYTTDNFTTSTIVAMSFSSGTSYSASIPAQAIGTTVTYYMFTSGNALTISNADADFYTINLLNNSGSNYSYTTVGVSRFAVAAGNWNATTSWSATSGGSSGASVPITGDDVIIEGGNTITVTATAAAKSVTFNGTTATGLTVNSGITLTVSGAVVLNHAAGSATSCTISGAGTINCGSITVGSAITPATTNVSSIMTSTINTLTITGSGDLTLLCRNSGGIFNNPRFYLSSGTLTIPGAIVPSNPLNSGSQAARFWMDQGSQNGTLILTGALPWSTNSNFASPWGTGAAVYDVILNGTNSTVIYNASGNQTINRAASSGTLALTYTNLTLAGSGNKDIPSSSTATVTGTLSFEGSATITTKAATYGASSTLQYKNGGRTTTALEWPSTSGPRNLVIDNSGNTVTMLSGNARTLTGSLTLTAGTLADNGNTLTVNGNIAGTGTHSGAGKILLNTTGSTISGATLGNLELNNVGGNFSLTGNPTINGTLTLANGTLTVGASGVVTIGSGGAISRSSGALAAGTGKFSFSGTGNVTGTVGFNDVDISGGVNFGSGSTINGILSINSGGFVSTNAPTYASGSILKYNTTGSYGRGSEWNNTSGAAGYPFNVQISNNTTLDLGANSGAAIARQCAGYLTVDAGSTLSLANTPMSSALTIVGKYTNNGTTFLSSISGGDLKLQGDMDDNGTFTANGRAIFFEGGNNQTINSATNPLDIDVIRIGKSGGEVILAQNLLVDETGDPIKFTTAASVLNLNGKTATFGKANTASTITMDASSKIKGSASSSLEILGTGAFGTVYFDQTTLGTTNLLSNLTINRTNAGNVILGSNLNVSSALTIVAGGTLVIATGKTLIVNGVLTNNGTMRLESNGVTSGQLFQGTTALASGDGTCEYSRVMPEILNDAPGQPGNMNRSYYFGSPVASAYSSGSYQPVSISTGLAGSNNTSLNLFRYNEVSNQFQNLITTGTVASNASFAPGMGYALISSPSINGGTYFGQATITGKYFMNGDITVNVTKTGTNGYNLLSNPYPSNLKWSDVLSTNSTIQGDVSTYWVRTYEDGMGMIFKNFVVNGADGQGVGTGGQTNIIAPGQAFWVKVGASGTFTFTNNMRTTDASNNSYTASVNRIMRFNLVNSSNGIDDIAVYLNENSSLGVDAFDSEKRIPSTSIHQLYTLEGTTKLAINGFNNALAKDTVLLGMQIPTAGTYSINASQIDATIEEDIFLEDKITGAYQNLKTTPNYSFTSVAGTFNNRFVLHFAPNVPALPGQTAATAIAMPTSNWPQCNNVSTEDQWHAFAATSEAVSIAVNTTTTDIVIELQDGTGNVVAQENAVNGIGNETLNFFGLTAGQTYKVGVRNNISSQPTGSYGICVKSLKRGGCDYGAGPYSLCQYYKATWAGSTGVSYTFTFTGTSGPAEGQTFTRTQNSDICVLSTVTPLLPYGSTYDVVISNTYTLTDGAGNTEQISVPSNSGCQVVTIAQPQTTLSASSSCNNGARFRGAVVSSLPWVCGANNWRWRFTEVNPLTLQTVGLPIELNRGTASNYLSLGTVAQLQNGKTYAVETAPMFTYTGTNYNWGPVQYMCIVGSTAMSLDGTSEAAASEENNNKNLVEDETNTVVYVTEGNHVNIQLTNTANNTAKRADIYDVTGKLVKSVRLVEGMNEVTLTETAGIYMVRTVVGNQTETARVFINN